MSNPLAVWITAILLGSLHVEAVVFPLVKTKDGFAIHEERVLKLVSATLDLGLGQNQHAVTISISNPSSRDYLGYIGIVMPNENGKWGEESRSEVTLRPIDIKSGEVIGVKQLVVAGNNYSAAIIRVSLIAKEARMIRVEGETRFCWLAGDGANSQILSFSAPLIFMSLWGAPPTNLRIAVHNLPSHVWNEVAGPKKITSKDGYDHETFDVSPPGSKIILEGINRIKVWEWNKKWPSDNLRLFYNQEYTGPMDGE